MTRTRIMREHNHRSILELRRRENNRTRKTQRQQSAKGHFFGMAGVVYYIFGYK